MYGLFGIMLIGLTFTLNRDNGRALSAFASFSKPRDGGSNINGRVATDARADDSSTPASADWWRSDGSEGSSDSVQPAIPQQAAAIALPKPIEAAPTPMPQPETLRHLVDAK